MIGKVTGTVGHADGEHVLVETAGGVGYLVMCSERTLAALPGPGEPVALFTELVVREDLLQLIGFRTLAEREWHRLLTSVQGVGVKAGLAILGTLGEQGVARALSLGDAGAIRAAPGVGPKLAQRLVLELQAKAPAVMAMGASGAVAAMAGGPSPLAPSPPRPVAPAAPATPDAAHAGAQARADALSALLNLGYGQGEGAAAIAEVDDGAGDVSALIRAALRVLAPKA